MFNVLIVDDNPKDRQHLINGLKKIATCTQMDDGEKALEAYEESLKKDRPFDFILLDVTMPKMDGFEVLRSIRLKEELSGGKLAPAYIFIITTYQDSLMQNYNMGWDDFITKPVDVKILTERMQAALPR